MIWQKGDGTLEIVGPAFRILYVPLNLNWLLSLVPTFQAMENVRNLWLAPVYLLPGLPYP